MLNSFWLNYNKPVGISSMKAVSMIKKLFGFNKVGHAGTLDPEAHGVLPIAIGEANKLIRYIVDAEKEYKFKVRFGIKTTTGDKEGEIIERTNIIPKKEDCINVCKNFIGKIEQTPPIYSAIKINGNRSYKLARKNIDFTIPKRQIEIFELKLLDYNEDKKEATYYTRCSKGTYIRSLAEDIAFFLQSLAFVIELERTRVGCFASTDADFCDKKLLDVVKLQDKLDCIARNKECVLENIFSVDINAKEVQNIRHGLKIPLQSKDQFLWIKHQNQVIATGYVKDKVFKIERVFN